MKKMNKKISLQAIAIFAILIVFAITFSSASFDYASNNIKTNYYGGEKITGKVKLNLTEEPTNSMFSSNIPGGISLLDLIKANNLIEGKNYTCSVGGCGSTFKTINEITGDYEFLGGEKVFGFKLMNNIDTINSMTLNINSDAADSCSQQLVVTVAEGTEFQDLQYTTPCGIKDYGCFDSTKSTQSAKLGNSAYCENITLSPAPAYQIGAKITRVVGGLEGTIIIQLKDGEGNELGVCNEIFSDFEGEQEVSCIVEYSGTETKTYQVCAKSDSGEIEYKIKYENSGQICGFNEGTLGKYDYEVFGRAVSFASSPNIEIDSATYIGDLQSEIYNYLDNKYKLKCPSTGCIVPIKIRGVSQTVTFSNALINYVSDAGNTEANGIHDVEESTSTISAENINFDLKHANFTIPIASTAKLFSLELGGEDVFSTAINITPGFEFDINPKSAPVGINVKYSITTTQNITSASWNFGDGTAVVSGKNVSHKYLTEGIFTVSVELTSLGAKTKKDFVVISGDAASSIDMLLEKYTQRLSNITSQVKVFPLWINTELKKQVNIDSLNASVAKAKKDLNTTNVTNLIKTLAELKVPYAIAISKSATTPLAIGYANIDTQLVAQKTGNEVGNEAETKNAIMNWIAENYDTSVKSETIKRFDDDGSTVLLMHFTIDLTLKTGKEVEGANLFINYPLNGMVFKENYGQNDVGSGTYIPLSGSKHIEFVINQPIEFANLGVYASAEITNLPSGFFGIIKRVLPPEFKFSWITFLIALIILVAFLLGIYIALQEWLKKNYEKGLFSNSDDFYNIMTFIRNSRNKGINDEIIESKLQKSGWRKEQIRYAFNKIEGKKILRFEIPIFRAI
ncbi:MAG: PKD domain-containing protein, partial [archaeon]|nr:PKD domain-containing protein [archaeon]